MKAYQERSSLHGLERIFGVSRQIISHWLVEYISHLPPFRSSLLPAQATDVLELNELWSFMMGNKNQKRWLWIALNRRTGQVVAFVIGDRSAQTCRQLWRRIPDEYRRCHSYSDFWHAYEQ